MNPAFPRSEPQASGEIHKAALRIGITPLTDSAPIVVAAERGFFEREGLEVEISREPSWANIRDKLAAGALEAAHMLAPMPLAATLGVDPVQQHVVTALSLGLGGNAITLSRVLFAELEALDPRVAEHPLRSGRALARVVAARRAGGAPPLRLGTVFPVSMHNYELRAWLAASGLAPDRDVQIRVVPPPRMVAALEAGALDGFCVGEPWNTLAVQRGSGVVATTKHDLWNFAPEKVLGVRLAWAEQHPEEHRALLRALLAAARWCDEPENRAPLAELLAAPRYVGVPAAALAPSLAAPSFHCFHRYAANFPWRSQAVWMLCQMLRWGQLEKPIDLRRVAAEVYRSDLYREAAADLGVPCPTSDEKLEGVHATSWRAPGERVDVELGADLVFDALRFDARDPVAYLAAHPIHDRVVRLDELAKAQHTAS
jgi:nitrate/nitrite transport system substrate-binding protein